MLIQGQLLRSGLTQKGAGVTGSQKDQNRLPLLLILAANAVIFYGLVTTQRVEPETWLVSILAIQTALPVALALALTGVLNSQFSQKAKEVIVFWEWVNPLPGCRAFSELIHDDPRIDAGALEARFGPFPQDPVEQNKRWYRIYSEVRAEFAVVDASRGYLFARDYACFVALMIPIFGGLSLYLIHSPLLCITYMTFLIVQFAFSVRSARTNAVRLVTTAMAIASTKHGGISG